ncbi:MAG: leucine-rich repeat domain-containing protein [Alphaproteobacteria bacterium]|nr:leucine-rich repeat domain-containing protein [Alphaproteobacteria bacterium]
MKKLFFIISAIFLPFYVYAWEACGTDANGDTANCEYQIVNGTLTIRGTGDNGNIGNWASQGNNMAPWRTTDAKNIVIENTIKDLGNFGFFNVSGKQINILSQTDTISPYAFAWSDSEKINIPNSTKSIGQHAFGWSGLSEINIPDTVEIIDTEAFRGTNLLNVYIPASVKFIGDKAFSSCSLETLTISEDTQLGAIFNGYDFDTVFTNTSNLKIYCTGDTAKCDAHLVAAGYPELKSSKATTKKINGVTYVYDKNGKLVTSSGHRTEKRIYTLEEANAVAGVKNRISIKYR